MADLKQLLIQPAPGFTPHIGVLVSTMQMCRETTIRWCQDLTIQQLDYLWDENANTIGALLLDNQGYGYIDEQTPELSIAIAPTHSPLDTLGSQRFFCSSFAKKIAERYCGPTSLPCRSSVVGS